MKESAHKAVAIVGVGAVMPDAPNAPTFWQNLKDGRYSITDVPEDRWDVDLYYDPDPKVPDKTYSKIGSWVKDMDWNPLAWKLPIPPKVSDSMDFTQKWPIIAAREALDDYGYPNRSLNPERTAVILGNAMGGDFHLYSAVRILYPEYASELEKAPSFLELPKEVRDSILKETHKGFGSKFREITEDTMPGELSNIVAGRIAALYDFKGPNYIADAACASTMAAISAAIEGLEESDYDAVITGGVDSNMSAQTFVKFCKIGALSATGTRPYAEGADGFIMGEGSAIFLIKRLVDAERDGDKIYAVIRALGGSSDGKGKGITAPNPMGQKLAVQRAWYNAGFSPSAGDMIEGHGTSTRVGDVAEVESLIKAFEDFDLPKGSISLGSVKSNIGHLKGAAGAAGMLKATYALHEKLLPPSLNFDKPNPGIDFADSPFYVNTELKPWETEKDGVRRSGVSSFGFGGTNFHAVMEEYIPGRIKEEDKTSVFFEQTPGGSSPEITVRSPIRGALVVGAESKEALRNHLTEIEKEAKAGNAPAFSPPLVEDLKAEVRIAIDYGDAAELAKKIGRALKALETDQPGRWKVLRAKGIYLGQGPAKKVAFLFTGQGSQYINMLKTLKESEAVVEETFAEADKVMKPLIKKPLTEFIYKDETDEKAMAQAEEELKQTVVTQPAVLATETAIARLLGTYGIYPDMVMGHSLGEYGALVASGVLPFENALKSVCARGSEMVKASFDDNGLMAAVFGPIDEIEKIITGVDGYVVIANINSTKEAVIGGSTDAVEKAMEAVRDAGYVARQIPVSHAFHTKIVSAASEGLTGFLGKMNMKSPNIPTIANISGDFYPTGPDVVPEMIDILAKQVSSPVQFVKGLKTLYDAGARVFVEIGPKRILYGFVDDVVGDDDEVMALYTNHPRIGDVISVNQALCGLYAAGLGFGKESEIVVPLQPIETPKPEIEIPTLAKTVAVQDKQPAIVSVPTEPAGPVSQDRYVQLGHLFAEFMDKGFSIYSGSKQTRELESVCITGAAIGLPGVENTFDDTNIERILRGDQFIKKIPDAIQQKMVDKSIVRLVKTKEGGGRFEKIEKQSDAIKLAARAFGLDMVKDFGFSPDRLAALDVVTQLAIAAGIDALRDAGIPLVMHYKTTTTGSKLPEKWALPEGMRDDTGVIFASAFPGYDSFADIISGYYEDRIKQDKLAELQQLRNEISTNGSNQETVAKLDKRIENLQLEIEQNPYTFDRRFLFRVLSMGHSQFAEYIGARGPNTQINGACASSTQGISIAKDWIQAGRCKRVIIISADDVTTDTLMEWFGAGFLASGAAATDEKVEDAAIPFDRRRHGLVIGMGGAAVVVESRNSAEKRGILPICDVLGAETANSAFHGSRLDINHICQVMEKLVSEAEALWSIDRRQIAPQMVFVSHETYTPARGGSASAEINALRHVFGSTADQIVIANTKGYTGHPMGVGIEDVVSVKILETGIVPPVANFKEVDPELGVLNLSRGGNYPVQYALRLGAGFGSQISMTLLRWQPTADNQHRTPQELGYLYRITDQNTWKKWLCETTGYDSVDLEVDHRTLRIKDNGIAAQKTQPAISTPQVAAQETSKPASVPSAAPESKPAETKIDPVQEKVMQLISEKTGYPTDMLDLDLDLEADLGIDTVKQAEMFAAIREEYNIPRDDNLKLRDYPTLTHTIQFVYDKRPDLKQPTETDHVDTATAQEESPEPPTTAPVTAVESDLVKEKVLQLISEKTGYPTDMLDLDLDLEADLGIDTVKQAEMFAAIREEYDIPRDDNLKLRDYPTLAHTIQFVYDKRPDLKTVAPETQKTDVPVSASIDEPAITIHVPDSGDDSVKEKILHVISEKTGYPADMLELDLDLEADLGIDTVKQAEMFAAIREEYDIPRDDNLKLRDYPTLAHTIQFVYDKRPDLKPKAQDGVVEQQTTEITSTAVSETGLATSVSEPADDSVKQKILKVISEKTGYPADMLELDLDLEADLGIDTVKQAEMFAAIREEYDIPRDDNLKLRDYPTLAHTIQFVYDKRPDLKNLGKIEAGITATSDSAPTQVEAAQVEFVGDMEAANKIPRRIPVPLLRPGLELCKATGVSLDSNSRVIVMPDKGGVSKALVSQLKKLGADVLLIEGEPEADELKGRIEKWKSDGLIQGVFWLPALDVEEKITDMNLDSWRKANQIRTKNLYTAMRSLYDQVDEPGTFLVSATRLGGQHGYDQVGAVAPLGGAVCGFTKAFKREKPGYLVKVVDFEKSKKTTAFADLLIKEALRDPGVVEIGYKDGFRWTIGFEEKPAVESEDGIELNKDSVFLITGAAGSIVSAITAELADASGGTFYLLDLAAKPDANDPDLEKFETDKEGLKREIFEKLKNEGQRATPAMVEKELAGIERSKAALSAIQAVEKAGGTAHYYSVNLLDEKAMAKILKDVKEKSGRIDVMVHAGGLEISKSLPDKEPGEFDLVFDVKSDGWFNLISNIGDMQLGSVVVFSSIAGRFGNAGQTDYSSANDLLCKSISSFRTSHPKTRAIAIDWTAWSGIGMAARGSIPTIMKAAGIDMLSPEAGIPVLRRELTCDGDGGEIVIAGNLGIMLDEFDETGGLDASELQKTITNKGIMADKVVGMSPYDGLLVETTLDPKKQPFLYDHQIDGTPVLPGVMGIEAMVETAKLMFPDRHLGAVEDVNFLAPFKFYRNESRTVTVCASFKIEKENIIADCRLVGFRKLHGQTEAEKTTHFTARICLTKNPLEVAKSKKVIKPKASKTVGSDDIYQLYFHGPAYQVVDQSFRKGKELVGLFDDNLPANHEPENLNTEASPRLIELCFQTAGLWEMGVKSIMGLPYHIDKLTVTNASNANGKIYAVVQAGSNDDFDARVVDAQGNVYLTLHGYRTSELPNPIDAEKLELLKVAFDDGQEGG